MAFAMQSLTPILIVDAIEPCLDFWHCLGFSVALEVPKCDARGFVILKNGPVEVMYQTPFYGATGFCVREPGGSAVSFSEVSAHVS